MLGNNNHTQPTFGARRTTWMLKTCFLAGWRQRCQATPPLSSDIAMSGTCPQQRHVDITWPISSRMPIWLAVTFQCVWIKCQLCGHNFLRASFQHVVFLAGIPIIMLNVMICVIRLRTMFRLLCSPRYVKQEFEFTERHDFNMKTSAWTI